METLWQDIRYGVRMLAAKPSFAIVAIFTLALGIGANTAIFTLIDAVLLRNLPVQKPDELALLSDTPGASTTSGRLSGNWTIVSYPAFRYFGEHNQVFQNFCAFDEEDNTVAFHVEGGATEAGETAVAKLVTGTYFSVLGVRPAAGRLLAASDDDRNGNAVAVLSYGYWQQHFGLDPAMIGRTIVLNATPFTVVGVAAPDFFGESIRRHTADIWVPLRFQPQINLQPPFLDDKKMYWLNMLGRLNPGVSLAKAQAELNVLLHQYMRDDEGEKITAERQKAIDGSYIELHPGAKGISLLRYRYTEPLRILMGIVAIVLVIACANLAALLLSRARMREREMSVRIAVGAGRGRLIRQLLTESVLLSGAAGALGLLFAWWGAAGLAALAKVTTEPVDLRPGGPVLLFTLGVSLLTGLLFGLAPAMRSSHVDLVTALKGIGKPAGSRMTLANGLISVQVGLCLLLLAGAGLLVHSLERMEGQDFGFDAEHVLVADINARRAGLQPEQLPGYYLALQEKLLTLPGVRSATLASSSPMSGSSSTSNISLPGYTPGPDEDMIAEKMSGGPRYLETMAIRLEQGRDFTARDDASAPLVAIVNEAFVSRFLRGGSPLGHKFSIGSPFDEKKAREIIGVIGNVKYDSLRQKPVATMFLPLLQQDKEALYVREINVRAVGDPIQLAADVRAAIKSVNANVPIGQVQALDKQITGAADQPRALAELTSLFGLLALFLASIGLYGVLAYNVARRTSEIGLRMALGAQRLDVLRLVVGQGLRLISVGIVVGLAASFALSRLLSSMLYEVKPNDPLTLVGVTLLLTIVALLASYIPAYRATRVDPMVALRYE